MYSPESRKWPFQYPDRIQLFSLPTPNGQKVSIALEELELPYEPHRIDIGKGEQFLPEYIRISPNSKIPAIIDPKGPDGRSLTLMESGAILLYLADKAGRLMPTRAHERYEALQWLFFQVGHIGPMFGQFGHFFHYARQQCDHPYPVERYKKETRRLLQVLEDRLALSPYIAGADYTIVDIAHFPWVDCLDVFYNAREELKLTEFPRVQDWLARCKSRPAYERGARVCETPSS
jgi:glutathione S-transferase